jgi:hypothetical protein
MRYINSRCDLLTLTDHPVSGYLLSPALSVKIDRICSFISGLMKDRIENNSTDDTPSLMMMLLFYDDYKQREVLNPS